MVNGSKVIPGHLIIYHEDIWGTGGIALPFLTLALDGGEWSATHLYHFTPGERTPVPIEWKLGEPQSQSVQYGEKKKLSPLSEIKRRLLSHPACSLVILTELLIIICTPL
jgi:hypothetical protein